MIYRKSRTFKDTFFVNLDENHLTIETEKANKIWAWREFSSMIETPGFFHLYFDSRSFFLIPKDVFENSDEVHAARMIMRAKIPRE
jgi:hypothetical protein